MTLSTLISRTICTSIVLLLFGGCTIQKKSRECVVHSVFVSIPEEAWHYQGPGMAASFLLMSSSGPSGAAIGIAIDQGIQKDILLAMDEPQLLVQSAVLDVLPDSQVSLSSIRDSEVTPDVESGWSIVWDQYGFASDMTSNRMTYPVVRAILYREGHVIKEYSLSEMDGQLETKPLAELITTRGLANQMLFDAALVIGGLLQEDIESGSCAR